MLGAPVGRSRSWCTEVQLAGGVQWHGRSRRRWVVLIDVGLGCGGLVGVRLLRELMSTISDELRGKRMSCLLVELGHLSIPP